MEINEYSGWEKEDNGMGIKDVLASVAVAVILMFAYIVVGNLELM